MQIAYCLKPYNVPRGTLYGFKHSVFSVNPVQNIIICIYEVKKWIYGHFASSMPTVFRVEANRLQDKNEKMFHVEHFLWETLEKQTGRGIIAIIFYVC